MSTILTTIALLCMNPNGSHDEAKIHSRAKERQGCQVYYLKCLKKRTKKSSFLEMSALPEIRLTSELGECILERN